MLIDLFFFISISNICPLFDYIVLLFSLFRPRAMAAWGKLTLVVKKKSSEIFKELETSAQMLFPWTPVMFLPSSEWENNVGFLT